LGSFKDVLGGDPYFLSSRFFNGEGINKFDINNGKEVAGRVVVTLVKGKNLGQLAIIPGGARLCEMVFSFSVKSMTINSLENDDRLL
jgi:hypothetical protein